MELLGERPVWSMSGGEMLSTLDQLDAVLAHLQTRRLELIAGLDTIGYAEEIGAHDTVQLLAFRYRLDRPEARRDVRLAKALPKYQAVSAALPASAPLPADDGLPADDAEEYLRPAQAEAIVSALERVPDAVPLENIDVAERELVALARHLSPGELRKVGQRVRDLLDTDGPEPDEHKAYARESLTLSTAPNGVKFRGYLANENAELLRSLIHAGARPHKTTDGELDPRPREKRQADALTTTLTLAATALDASTSPTTPRHAGDRTAANTSAAEGAGRAGSHAAAATGGRAAAATDASAGGGSADAAGGDTADTATGGHAAAATGGRAGGGSAGTADGDTADTATGGHAAAATDSGAGGGGAGAAAGRGVGGGLGGGQEVPGFGAKANITVTIDLQDLKAATADAIGDTVYGDGLSAAAIRRLACDARIIPLVLGSNSEPLDVGRSERLVTRAMRRALNTRDKGCVVCGAPPIQCDAHHLISWIDGGETKISNLVLLCRRHHIDLHAGDWTITITNGKVTVSRPTWADPPHAARPGGRSPTPPDLTTCVHQTTTFAIWGDLPHPQPNSPSVPAWPPPIHEATPNPWNDPQPHIPPDPRPVPGQNHTPPPRPAHAPIPNPPPGPIQADPQSPRQPSAQSDRHPSRSGLIPRPHATLWPDPADTWADQLPVVG